MKRTILTIIALSFLAAPAGATEFTSPNGQTGAGLATGSPEKIRLYGEGTAFYRSGTQEFFDEEYKQTVWAFPFVLGGGYLVTPQIELEARMAVAIGRFAIDDQSLGSFTPGNLYLGGNYLWEQDKLLLKIGGGLAFGPWTFDASDDRTIAYAFSALTNLEEFYMYVPETLAIVSPSRIEYRFMPQLAFTGDVGLQFYIPFDSGGDPELLSFIAPGAAYLVSDFVLGARLPLSWFMTDDTAQFMFEPYARYDFGRMFAQARFTLYLDNPYGFSFDEGNVWALHAGVGGKF